MFNVAEIFNSFGINRSAAYRAAGMTEPADPRGRWHNGAILALRRQRLGIR